MFIKYLDGNMGGIKQVNFVLMFMLMGKENQRIWKNEKNDFNFLCNNTVFFEENEGFYYK